MGEIRRFVVAVSAVVLLGLATGNTAMAGTQWCVVDPQIVVNGRVSDVEVSFDEARVPTLTSPVMFRVHVAVNAVASVNMPASAVPYAVQVLYDLPPESHKSTTVTVDTLVSSTDSFAVQTIVRVSKTVLVTVGGVSNSPTTITYVIGK